METAGERLKRVMDDRGWNPYRLAKHLEERAKGGFEDPRLREKKLTGASRTSIRNYRAGASDPPLEFLLAAAELMGENPDYLAYGGARTPADVDATYMVAMASAEATIAMGDILTVTGSGFELTDLSRHVSHVLGIPHGDGPPSWASGGLVEVWRQLVHMVPMEPEAAAEALGRALREPLTAFRVEPTRLASEGELGAYVFTMIPALMHIANTRVYDEHIRGMVEGKEEDDG